MTIDYRLYLATDRGLAAGRDLAALVDEVIAAGVTVVQLRDKTAPSREFYETGLAVRAVCRRHGVPLIVNDRVDLMLALDADGVHVGPDDLPLAVVRRLAAGRLVGYSAGSEAELDVAARHGADYVGIGPVFATPTKPDAGAALGVERLRQLAAYSAVPAVAIGGIHAGNAAAVAGTGVVGICVVSAILAAPDPAAAARRLAALIRPTA